MHVYCNRSQMTSQYVKNKKYDTRWSRAVWLLFFIICCGVFCDLLQYTQENVIYRYLFYIIIYTIKIQMVNWRFCGHEKRKTSLLMWSEVDLMSSVCSSIDHGQQPMKMHTEVVLLYVITIIYKPLLLLFVESFYLTLFSLQLDHIQFSSRTPSRPLFEKKVSKLIAPLCISFEVHVKWNYYDIYLIIWNGRNFWYRKLLIKSPGLVSSKDFFSGLIFKRAYFWGGALL